MSRQNSPRRRPSRPQAPRGGFTLLELLVALALLSIVLTLIYAAFSQISGSSVGMTREMEARQNLRVLLKLVVDDLQAAQYLKNFATSERASGIDAQYGYTEDKQFTRINLHAAVPSRFYRQVLPANDPQLHEIGYAVAKDEKRGFMTLLRRENFYLDNDMSEGGISVPIADRIEAFHVEFLAGGGTTPLAAEDWVDEWHSAQAPANARLPVAIRLTIGQRGADDKVYTESIEFNLVQGLGL